MLLQLGSALRNDLSSLLRAAAISVRAATSQTRAMPRLFEFSAGLLPAGVTFLMGWPEAVRSRLLWYKTNARRRLVSGLLRCLFVRLGSCPPKPFGAVGPRAECSGHLWYLFFRTYGVWYLLPLSSRTHPGPLLVAGCPIDYLETECSGCVIFLIFWGSRSGIRHV